MRTKLFMLFPLAGLAVAVIGVPASQGADPFVAGGPSSRMVALDRTSSDRALGRAVDLRKERPRIGQLASFGEGPDGALYAVSTGGGRLYRLVG